MRLTWTWVNGTETSAERRVFDGAREVGVVFMDVRYRRYAARSEYRIDVRAYLADGTFVTRWEEWDILLDDARKAAEEQADVLAGVIRVLDRNAGTPKFHALLTAMRK